MESIDGRPDAGLGFRSRVWLRVLIAAAILLLTAGFLAWSFVPSGPSVPDVRGNFPTVSYDDEAWIQPLLDAGYCVDFVYQPGANQFERDGHFEAFADTYGIGGVSPSPGSRYRQGSTVTVMVGGSPLGGPGYDWDSVPLICPPG